ncbi:MAG: hypothetical protein PHF86_09625 [Candidatus Nanoarchaeia archaeon]|jgi:hypothetical protein|nr:hypothetical protein [Candidatus Nanoarchaeia archaeon]
MCYTGKCKYEGYQGDCCHFEIGKIPEDAYCIVTEEQIDKMLEIQKKENYIKIKKTKLNECFKKDIGEK